MTEPDAWAARSIQSGWAFVTRTVVDGTIGKEHTDQTLILAGEAEYLSLIFDDTHARRRTPQEVLYDTLVIYKANGIRLLEQKYDWTEQKMSEGRVVYVGMFDADGVYVDCDRPDIVTKWDGACLSR